MSWAGKGANLGELARANFPVPDAFILTTEAYALAARAARVETEDGSGAAARLRSSAMRGEIAAPHSRRTRPSAEGRRGPIVGHRGGACRAHRSLGSRTRT
jgi:hypothetical protein